VRAAGVPSDRSSSLGCGAHESKDLRLPLSQRASAPPFTIEVVRLKGIHDASSASSPHAQRCLCRCGDALVE
jgi:hypothetical protein